MNRPLGILVGALALSLPSIVSATDSAVYQCPGPSNTILYTNIEQSDCHPITLGALTIAPTRTYSPSVDRQNSILSDRFDYTAPIGSMRNRLIQGYPPQDLGDGLNQPTAGLGRGPGYPYQGFGSRLGHYPHGFGRGLGYPHQNFGNGLGQPTPGAGGGPGHHSQSLGGASERHSHSFSGGLGHSSQRLGGAPGPTTGRLR